MKAGSRSLLTLLVIASVGSCVVGCSDEPVRAAAANGCTNPGCANTTPVGGASDGGVGDATASDVGTDALAADAGATVTGIVRPLSKFTVDPTTSADVARTVTVSAPRLGGGNTPAASPGLDGSFTLTDVAATVGGPTWLQVSASGAVAALDAVALPQSGVFQIPLFDAALPQSAWLALGIASAYPPAAATVVVHVFDAKGARLAGVTAAPFGDAKGPFYDDGADVSAATRTTGARGTLVFLGQTATTTGFNVTLVRGAKTYATVPVPLAPSAVSYLALTLD
jgi:hypothetical protein